MFLESFFRHGKIKLNYIEGPKKGPSFLLLPAYDNRWQSYSSIIPQLATNTHLFALDTRGRGRSDRTPGEYNLSYSLQDTIYFIEEVIQEPCHIFGHSNGGWIGLWLAVERPDLVSSIIVGDSGLDIVRIIKEGRSKEEKASNQRFRDWAGKSVDELVKVFSRRYTDMPIEYIEMRALTFNQVDPEIYDDWVEGNLDRYFEGYNGEKILRSLTCPVLVLRAENGMISWEEVLWSREINNTVMFKEMEDMNHWLGIQDGRESVVLKEIINFLYSF